MCKVHLLSMDICKLPAQGWGGAQDSLPTGAVFPSYMYAKSYRSGEG